MGAGRKPVTRFGRVFQRPGRPGWYVRVRRRGMADLIRMVGPTRGHAERYLARLEVAFYDALAAGRPLMPPRTTLAEFAKTYLRGAAARMAPASLYGARQHLEAAAARLDGPLASITQARVGEFLTWLRAGQGLAPGTANRYLSTLSGCFREAKARGLMPENPCLGLRRLPTQEVPPPYLSDADCRALEARAPAEWRPLLVIASETGLRLGELERLQWRDVDLGRGVVTVRESKSRRVRHVPLVGRGLDAARALPRSPAPLRGEEPVWPGLRRQRRHLARHFPRWARDAGLPRVTFHALRHGWASRLAEAGADLFTLQTLGGWASVAMVQRYAHHRPGDAGRRAVEAAEARRLA